MIGNEVYIGANSVIAGKISIGDGVLIGACSLVNNTVPDLSVVLGVPAIIISLNTDFSLVAGPNVAIIFVLEKGGIVQKGSYEELIQQPGIFSDLAKRQIA